MALRGLRARRLGVGACAAIAWCSCPGLASPASAATTVGENFGAVQGDCSGGGGNPATFLATASPGDRYTVPSAGVITSWSIQTGATTPTMRFKAARRLSGNIFQIVGDGPPVTPAPNQFQSFEVRIPVQAGDVIGGAYTTAGFCGRNATPAFGYHVAIGDQPVGGAASYAMGGVFQLDLAASLEPDCDADGFGDETQDQDTTSCPPAPETTITKGPKDKTNKKTGTFEFSANEAGSTFECSLDGGAFAACSSPHTVKVKKGKHELQVRATDAGNNVEGTPAADEWKVKKKKKR